MPRPISETSDKYRKLKKTYDFYMLGRSAELKKLKAAEVAATILEWAIEREQKGFLQGETIGVAAAAEGLGTSRSAVTEAMKILLHKGIVEVETDKSPYVIRSTQPVLPADDARYAGPTSITGQLADIEDALQFVLPLVEIETTQNTSQYTNFLYSNLITASDPEVRTRAFDHWLDRKATEAELNPKDKSLCLSETAQTMSLVFFRRVRAITQKVWALESTFLLLPKPESVTNMKDFIEQYRPYPNEVSLVGLLEHPSVGQLKGVIAGRLRFSAETVPRFLIKDFKGADYEPDIDFEEFLNKKTLIAWRSGLFIAESPYLLGVTIIYADPDQFGLYSRDMRVAPDG